MFSIRLFIDRIPNRPNYNQGDENFPSEKWVLLDRTTLYKLIGIDLILISGALHLGTALSDYQQAPIINLSFLAYFIVSIIAAVGISWGGRLWGWVFGGLIASGAIVTYLVSRTVGLAPAGVQNWGPPSAYFSMFVETVFFVPFIATYSVSFRRIIG